MKITSKVQLPGKCSSRKRGPSGTTECKALLTCSASSLLPSAITLERGECQGLQVEMSSSYASQLHFQPNNPGWDSTHGCQKEREPGIWVVSARGVYSGNAVILETLGTQHPPLPTPQVWPAWQYHSVVLDESLETLRTLWDPFQGSQKPKAFMTSQLPRSLSLPVCPKSRVAFLRGCIQHKCRCIQTDKAERSHH